MVYPAAHVLHRPSVPHPTCPVIPLQSASEQHVAQAAMPQHIVPAAHPAFVHTPPEHTSFVQPLPSLQSALTQHAAQTPPPQSRRPAGHVQAPPEQIWDAPQARPHEPQFARSVRTSASQPSASTALQSPNPGSHADRHAPAAQTGTALGRAPHMFEHEPQCSGSLASVHEPLHCTCPVGQAATQTFAEQ